MPLKQARVLQEQPRSNFMQCLDSNHNIANLEQRIQEIMNVDGKERRIVLSLDGGRVWIRRIKRGRKTKKNRNRFHTDCREPKLLCIYISIGV
jgi:hypothetical protein